MTASDLIPGVASLGFLLITVGLVAAATRRRWLVGWTGSPARLAECVIGIATVTVTAQLLGAIGLFSRPSLLVVTGTLALAAIFSIKRGRDRNRSAVADDDAEVIGVPVRSTVVDGLLSAAVVGLVATRWTLASRRSLIEGVTVVDSLHYHLPIAARFVQSGRSSDLHFLWIDPVWTFYPANVELHHAVGMVLFESDALSALLNLSWLALALLAGWVLGLRHGIAHLSLGVVTLVFAIPLYVATQPGSALNDAGAMAFLVAALALLSVGHRRLPEVAVAGLAAGLAAGTKVTTLAPLFAVTVVLVATAERESRRMVSMAWLLAMFSTGGFWYVRNTIRAKSPLPVLEIPGLPSPDLPVVEAYGRSVSDYVSDAFFWTDYVWPGLRTVIGPAHPVVFALAGVGAVAGAQLLRRVRRVDPACARVAAMLVAGGVVGCAAYVFTPVTAYGPDGDPFLFATNLRYLLPGLVCLLGALAITASRWSARRRSGLLALVAACTVIELVGEMPGQQSALDRPAWFVAAGLGFAAAWAVGRTWTVSLREVQRPRVAAGMATVLFLLVAGALAGPVSRASERWYRGEPISDFARALDGERIAIAGYSQQYRLIGSDGSNHVQYLGDRGPGGGFRSYRTCEAFRRAVHAGDYDYLVAGTEKWGIEPARELEWAETDGRAEPVLEVLVDRGSRAEDRDRVVVFRLARGAVDTSGCPGAS